MPQTQKQHYGGTPHLHVKSQAEGSSSTSTNAVFVRLVRPEQVQAFLVLARFDGYVVPFELDAGSCLLAPGDAGHPEGVHRSVA
eukprot:CAMPEP_0206578332 /NCGR_PEP_ID=MMETSP0325_2-20121206/31899_1 /ASSEMBLY_ACC=CAM_ASM_000347 /TAXON_ID=2866 /ORGANISM="Crypthecodinium cohnii, Strain Seligo" /LENGTH=83 /DNA_ID=CAMNT_0054083949 /DNA_START=199 /DNA_END=448 /DNA_ORIENTATION=+